MRTETGFLGNVCQPGPSCPRHPPGVSVVRASVVRRTERRGVSEAAVKGLEQLNTHRSKKRKENLLQKKRDESWIYLSDPNKPDLALN